MHKFLSRNRRVIVYGISLSLLLFLLKWLEVRLMIFNHSQELFTGSIALIFTGLGIWLALKLSKPKIQQVFIEREIRVDHTNFKFNEHEAERLGLSKRELEVLNLMSHGLSNQEIAERLFVSLNTVKTHSKNVFEKLQVVRRTQAIQRGKTLNLIP